jgi:DNA-binding winged helix-turn-helix (wHTH) protein/Tol biopolymer transport system component
MMAGKSFVFRFDDVEVREREFTFIKAGKVLTVEPKAFRTLLFLLHNPQKLISKEELLNAVWNDAAVTENSLTRCISLLRSRLGDDIRQPRYIATVATVGYRFVCKVEVSEDDAENEEGAGQPAAFGRNADVEANTNRGIAGAAADPQGLIGNGDAGKANSGAQKNERRGRMPSWLLPGAAILAGLAAAVWYLHHPLAPLKVAGYRQITHDGRPKILAGTDGSRLYFNQTSPLSTAQVAISGGENAEIQVALPSPALVDVSQDGSSFLVASPFTGNTPTVPIWNVRILGGSGRHLVDARTAGFSHDGSSVAFSTPQGDIDLIRSDGTGAHKLTTVGDDICSIAFGWLQCRMAWSPDGRAIRFTRGSTSHGNTLLWEVSSTGSGLHQVLPGSNPSSGQCCGRWTSDGKFFVFLSGTDIWALDERRGLLRRPPAEPVQLTVGPILWGNPIPSKDGSRIFAEGTIPHGELSRFDAKSKRFQPFLGGNSIQGVVFSPDGQFVAYVTFPEGILWRANRDGSNPVQLSDPPIKAFLPRWLSDGSQIIFYDFSSATAYIVSSQGGSPRKLLPEGVEGPHLGFVSPHGHQIVFSSNAAHPEIPIRILDLDSHQVTTVPGSTGLFAPRWSPDGRYLEATSTEDREHLKIFDFKTEQWSELPQKGTVDSPEWSHDSQFIYFLRRRGDPGVFRISMRGGEPEKIADLKDFQIGGWFRSWMGLDSTDAPLMLRDISSDDIYALTLDQK